MGQMMTQDILWRTMIEEIRGLRRDVQELLGIIKNARPQRPATSNSEGPRAEPSVKPLLTVGEVADLLRTSPKAVYSRVERGRIPGVVRLGRKILVRRDLLTRGLSKGGLT